MSRGLETPAGAAIYELAHPFLAEPGGSIDDELSAEEHLLHPARHLATLEQAVIDPAVAFRGADGPRLVRVEQYEIPVRADRDRALARKQPEELRGSRRQQLHDAVQRQAMPAPTVVD